MVVSFFFSVLVFSYILYLIFKLLWKLTGGSSRRTDEEASRPQPQKLYFYSRKDQFITNREKEFFKLLQATAGEKYYIFPQIHLSAIFKNETYGRYNKLAFQIINRRSIDYVLCDKQSLEVAYGVELDDSTHDNDASRKRDKEVNELFAENKIPLVRFRDYSHLSTDDVAKRFMDAKEAL